jgi:hypothetical protein
VTEENPTVHSGNEGTETDPEVLVVVDIEEEPIEETEEQG